MRFCIRDDDTSFFTTPEQLEAAYGEVSRWGPVSLAIVPFHRAGTSKGVPEKFRGRWSVHPLHDNRDLVAYLRRRIAEGRFEAMLHGFYHDERDGRREFQGGQDLHRRVADGRKYLEDTLACPVRVFVPPHNAIGPAGLQAIAEQKLHLGGVAGLRGGWSRWSARSWSLWYRLRRWKSQGGAGVPWVLDLGDHREIAGTAITPWSDHRVNTATFATAEAMDGVFCAATHYWELNVPSTFVSQPTVGGQLHEFIARARQSSAVIWQSVGDVVCSAEPLAAGDPATPPPLMNRVRPRSEP